MDRQMFRDLVELMRAMIDHQLSRDSSDGGLIESIHERKLLEEFEEKHTLDGSWVDSGDASFLRDLSERIMAVPVMYGVDQRDSDMLNDIATRIGETCE